MSNPHVTDEDFRLAREFMAKMQSPAAAAEQKAWAAQYAPKPPQAVQAQQVASRQAAEAMIAKRLGR